MPKRGPKPKDPNKPPPRNTRGPRPEPTALKVLKGNPGKRALNEHEPMPRDANLVIPEELDEVGALTWREMSGELSRLGLLKGVDVIAFRSYCEAVSQWVWATKEIRKRGLLHKRKDGVIAISPLVKLQRHADETMRRYAHEFGLTPSARSGIRGAIDDDGTGRVQVLLGLKKNG